MTESLRVTIRKVALAVMIRRTRPHRAMRKRSDTLAARRWLYGDASSLRNAHGRMSDVKRGARFNVTASVCVIKNYAANERYFTRMTA